MKNNLIKLLCAVCVSVSATTASAQPVTIYKAAKIYLCDTSFESVEAMAVKGDRILLTGTLDSAKRLFPEAKVVNYGKKYIYPGFIDAHCHFYGYAKGLTECNLVGTKSEKEVIDLVKKYAKTNKRTWIVGRGWDQNDWPTHQYPDMEALDKAFPNTPVFLKRIDGHAAWINSAAIKAIGLDVIAKIDGGEYLMKNDKFTGILIDNAVDMVSAKIPEISLTDRITSIQKAANQCMGLGLTTVDDAGLPVKDILFLDSLQKKNLLPLRMYAMLNAENTSYEWIATHGVYRTSMMHVGAVKFYLDGALGSRGALMKKEYCDRPGHTGLLLTSQSDFFNYSNFLLPYGYQVCVHAIGDSANSMVLRTFNKVIPKGMDVRWRIEHAQIIDPKDMKLLRSRSIIPSVQPTHATSDAPWVISRICESRLAGAYAYQMQLMQTGIIALGTDFPVESISPFNTFYSAVTRLDAAGHLKTPFLPSQALTRQQALLGMTIWAAIANFEEKDKGSLETGKLADFVVLNQDIMTTPDKNIPKTKVVATYIGNKLVYKK